MSKVERAGSANGSNGLAELQPAVPAVGMQGQQGSRSSHVPDSVQSTLMDSVKSGNIGSRASSSTFDLTVGLSSAVPPKDIDDTASMTVPPLKVAEQTAVGTDRRAPPSSDTLSVQLSSLSPVPTTLPTVGPNEHSPILAVNDAVSLQSLVDSQSQLRKQLCALSRLSLSM